MKKINIKEVSLRIVKFFLVLITFIFLVSYLFITIFTNYFFSQSDINILITEKLQDFLGRPVKIESSKINLNGSIKIKNIYVYEKDFKNFFLKSSYVLIKLEPQKIIKGIFNIKYLKFISPEINIIREKDGNWNFQDILFKEKTSPDKNSVILSGLEIEDGKVNIEDKKNSYKHYLKDIKLEIETISFSKPVNFSFSAFYNSNYLKLTKDSSIFMEGTIEPIENKDDFAIKNINSEISLNNMYIKLSGNISSFRNLNTELKVNMPQLEFQKIFKNANNIVIPPSNLSLKIKRENESLYLSGLINSINVSFNAIISYLKSNFFYTINFIVNDVSIEKIKFLLNKYVNNVKGKIKLNILLKGNTFSGIEKTDIEAEFKNSSFNDYYKIFEFNNAEGKFISKNNFFALNIVNTSAKLKDKNIKNMSFKWELEKGTEMFNASLIMNEKKVKIKGNINRKNEKIENAKFIVYNQSTDLDEIMDIVQYCRQKINEKNNNKEHNENYDFYGKKIDLYYKSDEINNKYGKAKELYFYSDIYSFFTSLEKLSANFKFKIFNGEFLNIEENSEKNEIYYLISLPITTLYKLNRFGALKIHSELKKVEFSEIGADYTLNNGKIIINSFYINGKDFMAYTTGDIDLNKNSLNLSVYAVNNKYYSMGGLPEVLTDAKGKPAIAFKITGFFKKTNIKILDPNYSSNIIKEAINKGIDINTKIMENF